MNLHFVPLKMKATHSSEMPGITYPSDAASCHRKPESLDTVSLIITRCDHVLNSALKGLATDTSKTVTDVVLIALLI